MGVRETFLSNLANTREDAWFISPNGEVVPVSTHAAAVAADPVKFGADLSKSYGDYSDFSDDAVNTAVSNGWIKIRKDPWGFTVLMPNMNNRTKDRLYDWMLSSGYSDDKPVSIWVGASNRKSEMDMSPDYRTTVGRLKKYDFGDGLSEGRLAEARDAGWLNKYTDEKVPSLCGTQHY